MGLNSQNSNKLVFDLLWVPISRINPAVNYTWIQPYNEFQPYKNQDPLMIVMAIIYNIIL